MGLQELRLIKPDVGMEEAYVGFRQEWLDKGEANMPTVLQEDASDFAALVARLEAAEQGAGLPDGWVPYSTYWLVNGGGRILGVVTIRHRLNSFLNHIGGHIGYGIRPAERGKGYAVRMLALALPEAKKLGLERVLVTCDATNTASERTIRRNGGVEDIPTARRGNGNERGHEDRDGDGNGDADGVTKRFWIDLRS